MPDNSLKERLVEDSILVAPEMSANVINKGSVTPRIFGFANSLVGHLRGGLGHVNVLAIMPKRVDPIRCSSLWIYSVDEYQQWLSQAGFKPRRVKLIPKDMAHKVKDGVAGWIRSTWLPYLSRIPEQMKEAFIEAILDAYLVEHPPDKDGLINVDMVRLEVEAVKP